MNYLEDELSEIALTYEDQEFGIKKAAASQSLMNFCETGHFNREQVNSIASKKVVLLTLEGWQWISLFQENFIREASGLEHREFSIDAILLSSWAQNGGVSNVI